MQYFGGHHESYVFNQTGRFCNANVEFVDKNLEIAPGIKLIVTSSSNMGYFSKYPRIGIGTNEEVVENPSSNEANLLGLKEISLSLETENGEVVIVGCSHSTVEKIILETKIFTNNQIAMVYGGYHLLPYDRRTLDDLSHRLKNELEVQKVAPAHCSGHLASKILKDHFRDNYVFAGLGETVEF